MAEPKTFTPLNNYAYILYFEELRNFKMTLYYLLYYERIPMLMNTILQIAHSNIAVKLFAPVQ